MPEFGHLIGVLEGVLTVAHLSPCGPSATVSRYLSVVVCLTRLKILQCPMKEYGSQLVFGSLFVQPVLSS